MRYDEYREQLETIGTDHGEFAYLDVGEGPATVFVHGLFVSGFMWARGVVDALRDERRCVVYNLPGHGGSTVPEDQPLTLEANAEMLEAFCVALGLDAVDLVANDTGGAIAQALAVRRPELVRTLTLTNCEARDVLPSDADIAKLVASLAEQGQLAPVLKAAYDDRDAARKGPLLDPYEFPDRLSDDDLRGIMEPHQASLEGARFLERFMASLDADQLSALEPGLRELRVPTLLVWGTGDDVFPIELAHWLKDTIPGCDTLVEVPGGKLFWPMERPDELAEPLRHHLASAVAR